MKTLLLNLIGIVLIQCTMAQNTWTQKANFGGTGRAGAAGFSIGTKGYIGTGLDNLFATTNAKDFWQYDQATNTWTQKANFGGTARAIAAGFSIGAKGYIGTGLDDNGTDNNDFWEYDPAANTWTKKADFPGGIREGATGFSIGSKGYLGTGGLSDGSVNYKDFWEYDPSANTWTKKADFGGTARLGATSFNIGSKGYIGNGYDVTERKDFWEYDPALNTWVQKADFGGAARATAAGFTIGTKGYVGTGGPKDLSSVTNDVWEFDPSINTWRQIANIGGSSRVGAVGFGIGAKGYIGTGYNGGFSLLKDFQEYTPGAVVYYFRTRQSGNWNDVNTWEVSADNTTWIAATATPDFNSNTITLRHNVNVTAPVTIDETVINSGDTLFVNPAIVLTINDGTGTDITVSSGAGMVVRSSASGTGSIGNSAGTISGVVTAERFISNKRAWRLLGIPFSTSSQTIKASWMEGGVPSIGYGTSITTFTGDGRSGNYDAVKSASSIRTFSGDVITSDAAHTPNTTNTITTNPAYFLYVRGDRSIDRTTSGAPSTATTLLKRFSAADAASDVMLKFIFVALF